MPQAFIKVHMPWCWKFGVARIYGTWSGFP